MRNIGPNIAAFAVVAAAYLSLKVVSEFSAKFCYSLKVVSEFSAKFCYRCQFDAEDNMYILS